MIKNQNQSEQTSFIHSNLSSNLSIEQLNITSAINNCKKSNQAMKSSSKVKPATQRSQKQKISIDLNQDSSKIFGQKSQLQQLNNRTDRQILLQKRKSYAQSIRQKNKQQVNESTDKNKAKISSRNSFVFTPPKDNQANSISNIQHEYYSLKKQFENSNDMIFKQTNMNTQNQSVAGQKSVTAKVNSIMNSSAIDSGRNNQNKKSINNKQNFNKPTPSHSIANHKKGISKCTTYAQIFDKKSTMNALLSHQKNMEGSASRKLNSIRKDKCSLRAMFSAQQNTQYDFGINSLSKNLEIIDCQIKDFMADQWVQKIDELSRIQFTQKETISNQNDKKNKLGFQSNVISETVDYSSQYEKVRLQEQKQIALLAKQNGTFKKQLATFRKENSTLKKQLQNSKNHIKQLEEKAKTLLEEHNLLLQSQSNQLNEKASELEMLKSSTNEISKLRKSQNCESNLEQILQSTQQELFSLKSTNKALQLKVYMLEKKLIHEQQLSKKRLANQINSWKQKYNKLRNQHLRVKNSVTNPFLNSDWSISMDISRDD